MSDMVERAAEALYLHDVKDSYSRRPSWAGVSTRQQQIYRDRVTVVMESMREPTEAMSIAGDLIGDADASDDTWQAMLDAALK